MPLKYPQGCVWKHLLYLNIIVKRHSSYASSFASLTQHLIKNHYITNHSKTFTRLEDGHFSELDILGNVLVKNWEAEWWKSVYSSNLLTPIRKNLTITSATRTEDEILAQTHEELAKHNIIALAGDFEKDDSRKKRELIIVKKQANSIMDYEIQFEQAGFLKNFFNKPSRIEVADGKPEENVNEDRGIFYKADETFHIQKVKRCFNSYQREESDKPSTTIFYLGMEQLFYATMFDAFATRNSKNYLKLNPRLAPVKVLVHTDRDGIAETQKLAGELCTMIRSWSITCWNGVEKGIDVPQSDELGTPYVIILPDDFVRDGMLRFRSLSSSLEMDVHLTHLHSTLLQHLGFDRVGR